MRSDVRFGSLADKPSRTKTQQCPLLSADKCGCGRIVRLVPIADISQVSLFDP